MKRGVPDRPPDKESKGGFVKPLVIVGAVVLVVVVVLGGCCGLVVFWAAVGSPWPIRLSDFAE